MIERIAGIASKLRLAHAATRLSRETLAHRTGMSVSELYDIEAYDDEILQTVSVSRVIALLAVLKVDPYQLFERPPTSNLPVGVEDLRMHLLAWLESHDMTVEAFEEGVGWDVHSALQNAAAFRSFNLDGLHDVASRVGVDWVEVVATEIARYSK